MEREELKMLRQFVDTVFDLTHALVNNKSPEERRELIRTIGSLAFSVQEISDLDRKEEANHD